MIIDINSLISALIGGLFALVGVLITIIWERKRINEEKKESSNPFFAIIDLGDSRVIDSNNHVFVFSTDGCHNDLNPYLKANFINSDKVEFIIEKISINNKDYCPLRKELISKGMSFMIKLNYEDDIKKYDVLMHITDISHNKRVYKLIPDGSMVSDFKEI